MFNRSKPSEAVQGYAAHISNTSLPSPNFLLSDPEPRHPTPPVTSQPQPSIPTTSRIPSQTSRGSIKVPSNSFENSCGASPDNNNDITGGPLFTERAELFLEGFASQAH